MGVSSQTTEKVPYRSSRVRVAHAWVRRDGESGGCSNRAAAPPSIVSYVSVPDHVNSYHVNVNLKLKTGIDPIPAIFIFCGDVL